ncbi:TetR/AcrR family transcriptional regulator [Gordonia hankookensis]|uniref:TetR family transcriptional regulator n=1 Tax=Gordonia hankookensis TaxID=589403 RepID=A0ABR7WFJ7_9ACTN|nr:TetR/AcrR family transcriptional regulator [Gordonia hankookensis]MBD1320657.1 TetR family transcriptional regulator [Gordonia hankookensis]
MPRQVPIDAGVDRRVRRSRAALFAAAVRLVSERGTTSVSLTELAEAADLSRQAVYSHFCDRDSVIVAAGIDLIERELFPALAECDDGAWGQMTLLATRHLAHHRPYYRALGTGPCAYPAKQAVLASVASLHNQVGGQAVRGFEGDDAVTFVVGGCFDLFTRWLVDSEDPLDPDAMADRLLTLAGQLFSRDLAESIRRP